MDEHTCTHPHTHTHCFGEMHQILSTSGAHDCDSGVKCVEENFIRITFLIVSRSCFIPSKELDETWAEKTKTIKSYARIEDKCGGTSPGIQCCQVHFLCFSLACSHGGVDSSSHQLESSSFQGNYFQLEEEIGGNRYKKHERILISYIYIYICTYT